MEYWKNYNTENIEGEVWMPFYDGKYYASSFGRIKTVRNVAIRNKGNKKIGETIKESIRHQFISMRGYLHCRFNVNGATINHNSHYVIALAFHKKGANDTQVNHIDGNKLNNIPSNLEWCTSSQNILHGIKNGLSYQVGERHHKAKLKTEQVLEIRDKYKTGNFTQTGLANEYGVSQSVVWKIIVNKSWSHVK